MKLAAIIGWPVSHSLSPVIHRAAFAATGLDWTYVPLAIRPDALEEGRGLLDTLDVSAANVTMPHKLGVMAWCDELSDEAERIGAVNTLTRTPEGWRGDNTDARGFRAFLQEDLQADPSSALVIGAGGSARAVVAALADMGVDVAVAARRPEAAGEVASLAGEKGSTARWAEATDRELLVQTTPVFDEELPKAYRMLGDQQLAVELGYGRDSTAFQEAAKAAGARYSDGLGMLLRQAAFSFEIWTGVEAPLDAMREAAEEELALRR